MKNALMIVDMQNDYFSGGKLPLNEIDNAANNIARLLNLYRKKQWPIIHVQHLSLREGAVFFIPNTQGVEIKDMLKPEPSEILITKHFPNSFRETNLLQKLHTTSIDTLTICGAMSHMCIDATTRAAFDLGFSCTVVSDACTTMDLTFDNTTIPAKSVHGAFMAALEPVYANVTSTEKVLTMEDL